MNKNDLILKLNLLRQLRIVEARENFFSFCNLIAPDFYLPDRKHLRILCDVLQKLYEGTLLREDGFVYKNLMINMPPRHGKTRTLILFCEWCLGKNKQNRIISCSYNDDMASDFSRYTRDGIRETKTYPYEIVYSDIFPDSKIKQDNASFQQWALEKEFFSYKGAGIGGSITGKGCNIALIDDPIKNSEEAFNENTLEKIWAWYIGTFLSRREEGAIQIFNMTRWATKDPCGKILDGIEKDKWYVLKMEAKDEDGNMLCKELLSEESYQSLKVNMDNAIFEANYHQEPFDLKGKLYTSVKTYEHYPNDIYTTYAYTDTADEGDDYLVSIVAGLKGTDAYVKDVYISKDGMEITEEETAKFFIRNQINIADIESNNGGRGFARNVKALILKQDIKNIDINWFHQSGNKTARILSNSNTVMQQIYFPYNWKEKFPLFYKFMTSYQREGKNKFDDVPDCITGIAERLTKPLRQTTWYQG